MADLVWTPEQDAQLVKLFEAGLSAKEIGKKFGRSRNSVLGRADRLRRRGQTVNAAKRSCRATLTPLWTKEDDAKLIELIEEGRSLISIAPLIGRSDTAISKRLAKLRAWGKPIVVKKSKPLPPPRNVGEPAPLMVSLMENRGCKWPHGDPLLPGFGYCGHPRDPDKPYCPHHLTRASYLPATNRASPPAHTNGVNAWRTENLGSRNAI